MPVFYLDDQPIEFEPGEKVLAAALRNGVEIPHYCYHPALSIVATCRMCLVDVVDMGNGRPSPKLQTSCSTDATEGMKVETQNKKVEDARQLVMEFLLINHPLDCPICDQSGECTLQDYSYSHGTGASEMEYSKRVYGWRDIGSFVTLERNRCIHCTRCERFTSEITGTHEFGLFNRGHQLTVDTFTDSPMSNAFQGNMADLCPVGCITEKEFRFKKRAWKLDKTESICTGCSTGCNITIEHHKNEVYRFKPRENQSVNQWWMCDEGRIGYRQLKPSKHRINAPAGRVEGTLRQASWKQSLDAFREQVKSLKPSENKAVALVDTHANNEELFLLKQLMQEGFQSENVFFPKSDWTQPQTEHAIDSLITTDKAPNQAGAMALGLKGDESGNEVKALLEDAPSIVIVLGNPFQDKPELLNLVEKAQFVVSVSSHFNAWTEKADLVLAGCTYAEKEGTYTNKQQRVQYAAPALRVGGSSKPQWEILKLLLDACGKGISQNSPAEIFDQMAQSNECFANLNYAEVGSQGAPLVSVS